MSRMSWGSLRVLYPEVEIGVGGLIRLPEGATGRLGRQITIAPTLNFSLGLYSDPAWHDLIVRWEGMPRVRSEVMSLFNGVRDCARTCAVSREGCVEIPIELQRRAYLGDHVLPVASPRHIELWDPEIWAARQAHPPAQHQFHVSA